MDQIITAAFHKERDAAYAQKQSAYLKHQFLFFGISKPKRAALQKEIFKGCSFQEEELRKIVEILWNKPEREFHYAAIDLLIKHKKVLSPAFLITLEEMIRKNSWWDTVDTIAAHLVGGLVFRFPALTKTMDLWISDEFLWIKRSALLFQLKWKKNTDEARLSSYCEAVISEKNFFLRKGVGWVLREYSKTHPEFVRNFVQAHPHLSPLSLREAGKYLNKITE